MKTKTKFYNVGTQVYFKSEKTHKTIKPSKIDKLLALEKFVKDNWLLDADILEELLAEDKDENEKPTIETQTLYGIDSKGNKFEHVVNI